MRVLHTIHSLSGGGAEKQLRLLANSCIDSGVETAIFCVKGDHNLGIDKRIRIYRTSSSRRYYLKILTDLRQAIREFDPHIIHTWLPATISIPSMILNLLSGRKCIFSFRDTMLFRRAIHLPEFIIALFCCNRIVSNNPVKHSRWYYRWLFSKKNGVVIPNAVDVSDEFRKTLYFSWEPKRKQKLLFVGRITEQKNWRCLVEAVSMIPSSYSWELLICGNGEELAPLRELISEGNLIDRVQILGYRKDVYKIMQSCDVLIFPSWREGMPNVLLEAFYIGLPCIVSDIGSIRTLVQGREGAVLMFDPCQPKELARQIEKIFNSPELARSMAQEAKKIASIYTLAGMVSKYHLLYREVYESTVGSSG